MKLRSWLCQFLISKKSPNPEFNYDIVLSGINLGLFHYNILPFFHSGQVKEGFNISRIRNTLSILSWSASQSSSILIHQISSELSKISAQKILEQEHIIFPLAAPYEYIKSKDTVLGLTLPEFLPGRETLVEIISNSYFKKMIQTITWTKNICMIFLWLKKWTLLQYISI